MPLAFSAVELRPARESDLSALMEIYNDAVLHTTASYDYDPVDLDNRREWLRAKAAANYPVLVAAQGQDVLGYASYGQFRAWRGFLHSAEHSVYVAACARGRGLGERLLLGLIEAALQNKVHTLIAGIDAENAVSLHLHAKLGFEQTAHMKEVGYKFGRWLDLVFMQLMLE